MIEQLFRAALDDAEIHEDTAILFLIDGPPPANADDYAYLPPGHWGNFMHRVLYDAGPRIQEFAGLHRFASYSELDAPEAGTAAGLRHEAQHAVQFNNYGHGLFNLESVLRLGMERTNRMGDYHLIPTERDANSACREYVQRNYAKEVGSLEADERFRHFVQEPETVADLLDETVKMVWEYIQPDEIDDEDAGHRAFSAVVPEFRQAALDWEPTDARYRVQRPAHQALVIEIEANSEPQAG